MSELITTKNTERGFRWHLLASVSALALIASINVRAAKAADEDADRPTVWVELGGELEHTGGQGNPFAPGFLTKYPDSSVLQGTTPLQAQNPPPFEFGEDGKISFQPKGSDWVFSGAVRYGRSSNSKAVHHQTTKTHDAKYKSGVRSSLGSHFTEENFADTHAQHRESHIIVDFTVGKDVGLGMFGKYGSSILSLGARFAQFASRATFDVRARPDLHFKYAPSAAAPTRFPEPYFHTYHLAGNSSRSFHGIGPTLSWSGSTPFVGNPQQGEITFDWGADAAILFGKQIASVRHQETGRYFPKNGLGEYQNAHLVYQSPGGHDTDRSVTVPNGGGFAGASWRLENVKVSAGYRADLFFNAMDVGIDARKSSTLGIYGPFVSVSIGLGG